jgi:ATP-binding cassette, subfamily A (ABC1), member 3
MSEVPGARKVNDLANRYEVPIRGYGCLTLAQLFRLLANKGALEFTVEKATLERVFLKVVNENKVLEEDSNRPGLHII